MVEDTGLQAGAADLREQELLLDYTLKVQDQRFRVHKFVLASVSDYFRAMVCGSMSESMSDEVELKELNAEHVSELLKFIYTTDTSYIDNNPKQMLELAVYFQMPNVIRKCALELQATLSVENCLELLSTFKAFSMDEDFNQVKSYMKDNMSEVMQQYSAHELTLEGVIVVLDNWSDSEWGLFQYLQAWVRADLETRNKYTNSLMSKVRYSIMSVYEIRTIMQMNEFLKAEGSWNRLVEEALEYHNQTTLQRVANDSEQTKFRFGLTPFLLNIDPYPSQKSRMYVVHKRKDDTSYWKKCDAIDSPEVTEKISHVIEANNFLITCTEFDDDQTWQVFDPLKLSWAKMPSMTHARDDFAMVYHNKHLYVLGGSVRSGREKVITDLIDEFSFETNSWSSTKKLPFTVKNHSACALNGSIYICGGEVTNGEGSSLSTRMDCLELSSNTWRSKAPIPKSTKCLKMGVMMVAGRKMLVMLDVELNVRAYNPVTDEWAQKDFSIYEEYPGDCCDDDDYPVGPVYECLRWRSSGMILISRSAMYILNIHAKREPEDRLPFWVKRVCVKVKFVEGEDHDMGRFRMRDFPIPLTPIETINAVVGVLVFTDKAVK